MTSIVVLVLLFAFLALGSPVGFAMAISGALGLYLHGGSSMLFGVLATAPVTTTANFELVTIPMFMLMAELVLVSGAAEDLFKAAAAWVGRVPGGLGMATAMAGAGFGAICGSSAASAATLSASSLPAMLRQGYEPRLAAGVVAISGTLAMLVPPSIALIIYGLIADVNIGKLLVAGIIPGILIMLVIMGTVWLLVRQDPKRAPAPRSVPWGERIRLLRGVGPMLALFLMMTVTIYTGTATPTEAAAFAATGAFILFLFSGKASVALALKAFQRAARSSCMIVMILIGAHLFSYFFAFTQVTQDVIHWVGTLDVNRWVVIVVLLAGYIVLGCFMDQVAILVLTVPVVVPLIISLGFDPVWFGILKILTAEVGMVTPPLGLNCFIVSRYARQPVVDVFHGSAPHVVAHFAAIAIMVAFPQIVLWLPGRMG